MHRGNTSHLQSGSAQDSILSQQLLITGGSILENNRFYGGGGKAPLRRGAIIIDPDPA